jgi:hypothetical protein
MELSRRQCPQAFDPRGGSERIERARTELTVEPAALPDPKQRRSRRRRSVYRLRTQGLPFTPEAARGEAASEEALKGVNIGVAAHAAAW